MSRVSLCASFLAAVACLTVPAFGQAVISTHSGVVHFFEGTVTLNGQPIEARFGRFNVVPDGAELRTEQGRAEVLLTPGVFLRMGEKSAIKMAASALSDTRVELLEGSAILESAEPAAGTAVTVVFKNWKIEQPHQGAYRIDCQPPRLEVRDGEVKVAALSGDAPVTVEKGMDLPFAEVLVPEKSDAEPHDALSEWADGRTQSISADNAIAADIQDPATMSTNPYGVADGFTYFPMLGYPAIGLGLSTSAYGVYGAANPFYQPGFYSVYLPGLTYRPSYLRLPSSSGIGLGRSTYPSYLSPVRVGSPGVVMPRPPIGTRPVTTMPSTVGARPAPVAHPAAPVVHPIHK